MAWTTLDNPIITVGGTDVSAICTSVSVNRNKMVTTFQAFGAAGPAQVQAARSSGDQFSITVRWDPDSTATTGLLTFFGTNQEVIVQGQQGDASATNPQFKGVAAIAGDTPLDAEAGDVPTNTMTWDVEGEIELVTS